MMVCTVHSSAAVVEVVDVVLEVEDVEPSVAAELEVVPGVDVEVVTGARVVVGESGDLVVVVSATDEVVSEGATATARSPTWESAKPTICHVRTVVTTRATTHAAAMRQLIMCQLSQDHP